MILQAYIRRMCANVGGLLACKLIKEKQGWRQEESPCAGIIKYRNSTGHTQDHMQSIGDQHRLMRQSVERGSKNRPLIVTNQSARRHYIQKRHVIIDGTTNISKCIT
jgi:hypothetical protein